MKKRDAAYFRRREEVELERAVRANHNSARRAHLGLADLYRRELERLEMLEKEARNRKTDRLAPD